MRTLVNQLVDFGYAARFDRLPAEVVSESKRMLLDSVGCALAALTTDKGKRAVQVARRMGGPAEARVIGSGDRLSSAAAAFANGELINALDFDLLTIPPGHVTPYVLPPLLALAEKHRRCGRELIAAIAVAHEVSARFGRATGYYRDVTPGQRISIPPISGFSSTVFGGTLAAALLSGLDAPTAAQAMGLAGHIAPVQSLSKYARTVPGIDSKYLMSGWICQADLMAVLLAEQGYRGDVEVLEGEVGFWRFVGASKWNPEPLTDRLGEAWQFPSSTIYKPYPHCRNTHTALDCLSFLIREHGLKPDEIERVTACADSHTTHLPLYATRRIESPVDAQMSTAYAVSMVVHGVPPGPEWHDDETLRNPRYLAFMDKVFGEPHPDFEKSLLDDPQSRIGRVEIVARGRTFSEERRFRKGSPATPETFMTDDELIAKFRHNAARVLTVQAVDRAVELTMRAESLDDVSELFALW